MYTDVSHTLLFSRMTYFFLPLTTFYGYTKLGMANHSSILAWKIPLTEENGGLQSMKSQSQTRLSDWHYYYCGYIKLDGDSTVSGKLLSGSPHSVFENLLSALFHACMLRGSAVCTSLLPSSSSAADQTPLFMGLSRQENCRRLPFPLPGDLPEPGFKPVSHASPTLAGGILTT